MAENSQLSMTYGFRIHFEYYYLKQAQYYLDQARKKELLLKQPLSTLQHVFFTLKNLKQFPEYSRFEELRTDYHASTALANIMLSCAYESFINYFYNQSVKYIEDSEELQPNDLSSSHKTRHRLFNKACRAFKIDHTKYEASIHKLEKIYQSRNNIIHYKATISYQGFGYQTPTEESIKNEKTQKALHVFKQLLIDISNEHPDLKAILTITKEKFTLLA